MRKPGSPKKANKIFTEYWKLYISKIIVKKNYDKHHLELLEILCDLHVDYKTHRKFLDKHGTSFTSEGRYGRQTKKYPEVDQMNNILKEIRYYIKALGLEISEEEKIEDKKGEWD